MRPARLTSWVSPERLVFTLLPFNVTFFAPAGIGKARSLSGRSRWAVSSTVTVTLPSVETAAVTSRPVAAESARTGKARASTNMASSKMGVSFRIRPSPFRNLRLFYHNPPEKATAAGGEVGIQG